MLKPSNSFFAVLSIPITHSPFPITHYPFPIPHSPFPITHYPFPIPYYLLPITHYPLPITYYPLPITHSPFPIPYRAIYDKLILLDLIEIMVCSLTQPQNIFANSVQRFKRYGWTTLLIWVCMVAPAQAQLLLRVAIGDGANQVKVGSTTKAVVRDGNGKVLGELGAMGGGIAQAKSGQVALGNWRGSQLWIDPSNGGNVWIANAWYRGRVLLVPRNGGLTAVNYVDLEQYLYSVLGAEMDGGWPQEALKAQAVAARTYALYKRQRSNGVFDVGDDQNWQVYKGLITESTGTQSAVNATRGQVLTYNGQAILAAFHSASGGHTENVEDVWNEPLPYLRGVPDFDQGTPVFEWTKTFSQTDLSKRISGVGTITAMTPQRTSAYGSILAMKVVGDKGARVMSGDDIASVLGLRSTRFQVNRKSGTTSFQVTGRGFGHGVGLSQWGAYNLARGGYGYQQILAHYYRNTALAKIDVR